MTELKTNHPTPMKDSGVEWVGQIPDGWSVSRLKYLVTEVAGGTPDTDNLDYWREAGEGIPWVAIGDMSQRSEVLTTTKAVTDEGLASKRLHVGTPGTILFAMYASVGEVSVLRIPAVWNQALLGLVPRRRRCEGRFLYYALLDVKSRLPYLYRSNTQNNLNAEQVGNLDLAVPSLAEQQQIADYLDRETAQIDALIGKQERLVDVLDERRSAMIAHAVTRGISSKLGLKDSGSRWFGSIPQNWELVPCGSAARLIQTGPFGSQLHAEDYVDDGVPVINPSHLISGCIVPDVTVSVTHAKALELARHRLELDDVVVGRRGELGRGAVVGHDSVGFLCGTGSALVRLKPAEFDSRFFQLVFGSEQCHDALLEYSVGATMDNLSASTISHLRLPCPPVSVQGSIVDYLDRETAKIDALVEKAQQMNTMLRERRSALISAAVTGKIDVMKRMEGAA